MRNYLSINRLTKILFCSLLMASSFFSNAAISDSTNNENSYNQQSSQQINNVNTYQELQKKIESVISTKALKGGRFAIAVYSLGQQKYIYSKNIDKPLVPASNTKLFTTFTALAALGKDFQIRTSVYADGEIVDGILKGDLYIVGRGDALLSTYDIEYLADEVKNKGIYRIEGNIYGDGSFFDKQESRMAYSGDRDMVEPLPPITALTLERNTATVIVKAGSKGSAMKSQVIPASDAFRIVASSKGAKKNDTKSLQSNKSNNSKSNIKNKLNIKNKSKAKSQKKSKAIKKGKRSALYFEDNGFDQKYGDKRRKKRSTPNATIQQAGISTSINDEGIQIFSVSGRPSAGRTSSRIFHFFRPSLVVAGFLKNRLQSGGVTIKGGFGEKSIQSVDSNSLKLIAENRRLISDLIYLINKNSDNFIAENLYKLIGANQSRLMSNGESSRITIKKVMDSMGIPCESCSINDGSGLSRRNLVTAESLINILIKSKTAPFGKLLDSTLSIATVDGTLRNRMWSTYAAHNLHAKTGTHSSVSALSGYVYTRDGEELAFSFIFNGGGAGSFKMIENELGAILAGFTVKKEELIEQAK